MDILGSLGSVGISVVAFVSVFGALVFFHELGHFWMARRFGTRIEAFSIGFGPALVKWYDKQGVEWRIAAVPLGGYVKFFGDANGASTPSDEVQSLSEEEKKDCFHYKPLYQRSLIVAAGPVANFILAIVIYAVVFMTAGQPYTAPEIGEVVAGTPAERAGIMAGDRILTVDGVGIESFEEFHTYIVSHPNQDLDISVMRGGRELALTALTEGEVREALVGTAEFGKLGVKSAEHTERIQRGPIEAWGYAVLETRDKVVFIVRTVGELIVGARDLNELSGPLGIGHISGKIAQISVLTLIMFAALLSINLGLINLFPIPMLDGGHLLYYACEAVRGRPLSERAQEYGFRVGLALVLLLMVRVTWNDIGRLVS